jgi:A/G-specific adenine glycosylase
MPHPITAALLTWYSAKARNLPWRDSKNPYCIWLSEVILQQTRVDQGLKYYHHFTETYPTVLHLAKASEDEVLRSWQGLGYYSRARNLHAAAQQIVSSHHGQFPTSYEAIRNLKGVGDYTAAAVASIAFSLPYPAVDGNVNRVISRLFCVDQDPLSTQGKARIKALSSELLSLERPGTFNQAMMELGATVCKPRNPLCDQCPVNMFCEAYRLRTTERYPVKKAKADSQTLRMLYIIPEDSEGFTYLRRRSEKGIWQGLYEFPLIHLPWPPPQSGPPPAELLQEHFPSLDGTILRISEEYTHLLSHRKLLIRFLQLKVETLNESPDFIQVALSDLNQFALPRAITRFLSEL